MNARHVPTIAICCLVATAPWVAACGTTGTTPGAPLSTVGAGSATPGATGQAVAGDGSAAGPAGTAPLLPSGAAPKENNGLAEALTFKGLRLDAPHTQTGPTDYELNGAGDFALHNLTGDGWRQVAERTCAGATLIEEPDRFTIGSRKGHVYTRQGCDRPAYFLTFPSAGILIASYDQPSNIIGLESTHATWTAGESTPSLGGVSILPDGRGVVSSPTDIREVTFKSLSLTLVGMSMDRNGSRAVTIAGSPGGGAAVRLHDVAGVEWKTAVVSDCPAGTNRAATLVRAGTYTLGGKKANVFSRVDCSDEVISGGGYYAEFPAAGILIASQRPPDSWPLGGAEWTS